MAEHTPTPWKVFTTPDGRRLVGIGGEDGEGILDCGYGVWQWDDAAGIANANLVVKAVNNHDALVEALAQCVDRLQMVAERRHPNSNGFIPQVGAALEFAKATLSQCRPVVGGSPK